MLLISTKVLPGVDYESMSVYSSVHIIMCFIYELKTNWKEAYKIIPKKDKIRTTKRISFISVQIKRLAEMRILSSLPYS